MELPAMQEIERLVNSFEKAVDAFAVEDYSPPFDVAVSVSRAALMAAIRQLSNSTQDGE